MAEARRTQVLDARYELAAAPIARGGMGDVWEGTDVRLGCRVAVKFVRFPGDADEEERTELVRRFLREAKITAELQHPGVPSVFDIGYDGDRPYLVMQLVRGVSVADLVAEQVRLPVGWAAGIAAQVCAVLAVAHRASLVPRDLKPGNLMLEPDGTVKVLDFGLASKQVSERPQDVRSVRPEVPESLTAVVAALLEKRQEDRPSGAVEVYGELIDFAEDLGPMPGILHPPSLPSPQRMYGAVLSRVFAATKGGPERPR
ncbi:serine/threonine-protein kinase [Nocardiopsis lambiniae]|uniref:non-specific serine/threonine protein kinase n=1 Tax=Nocardiopsis lambiniae TaxID=3075539 RepID=A0ABU2MAA5_9ACTN|nr:serine/threonine-protein kinase [Nocardiopsis sp. DSM 44743]MDT0329186.1 serine/threonine-protein kinase [Nocardiopsis sp. DSM 44743]